MDYQLFDKDNNPVIYHDLQDKGPWCAEGQTKEEVFISTYGARLKLAINPEKKTNKYAPDLIRIDTKKLGDLKTQNTPFFTANQRYGTRYDPQYTVVFNVKDAKRYGERYPHIAIYYWVDWIAVRYSKGDDQIEVDPMTGIWRIDFEDLCPLLKKAQKHPYLQRLNDTAGNARESYLLNIRDLEKVI